jgi:hypothetical protein
MFASRDELLQEAERHERMAAGCRADLARLDDPYYARPFDEQGEAIDYGPDRKTFARDAESAAAWAARLRRFAAVW